jgi:hypothetical protein
MVGQFDMNDTDNTKSTGFLYPASRLVTDEQGEFHYDLAGSPWSLVNVLDSNWAPALAGREAPDATGPTPRPSMPIICGNWCTGLKWSHGTERIAVFCALRLMPPRQVNSSGAIRTLNGSEE